MIGKFVALFSLFFLFLGCSSVPYTSGLLECDTDLYTTRADVNLFNAAKTGDLNSVNEALSQNAKINVADRLGQIALMWASWNGHSTVIKRLIQFNDDCVVNKKKKYEPLNYETVSKEKYNALFCLIMSNSIPTKEALSCIDLILEREPSLLTITDQYNENCLHKAVRSGNEEYLIYFLEKIKSIKLMEPKNTFSETLLNLPYFFNIIEKIKSIRLIEQKNTFSETPLILAVKLHQPNMTKILIDNKADLDVKDASGDSLSVLAFDYGEGDYNVFLEIMKEKLVRGHIEDDKLKKVLDNFTGENTIDSISSFRKVYNKFSSGDITNPEELDDGVFKETEKKLFNHFEKSSFSQSDINEIDKMLYETPALMYSTCYFSELDMYKTPLQLSIESGNIDLFNAVFKKMNVSKIRRAGRGIGDYLICAILNKQPEIVKFLLDYESSEKPCPEELMATHHGLSSSLSSFDTSNPVVQFIMSDNLRCNRDLLKSLLSYYKPEFAENTNYAGQIFEAALKCNDESLLLLIKDFKGFSTMDKVFDGRPIQFELIENDYFDTLKYFIENGNLKYHWKDTKYSKSFKDILESRKSEPEVAEILDLLHSKGIFVEDKLSLDSFTQFLQTPLQNSSQR